MAQSAGSRRRWLIAGAILTALLGALLVGTNIAVRHVVEKGSLTTGPNGSATPNVPFERVWIPSGRRKLDSFVVTADKRCRDAPAIVIYHGANETVSDWVKTQQFLYQHCVSSIVFDPTGSGNSPRPGRISAVNDDAVAAYEFARGRFVNTPIFMLGHSIGNGPMLEAIPHLSVAPTGVIVANAFSSLRSKIAGKGSLIERIIAHAVPDWWDNVASVARLKSPVLVIHSDKDEVNPVEGAQEIFLACHRPRSQIILYGFGHNALYEDPVEEWWSGVFDFLASPVSDGPSRHGPRDRNAHHFHETSGAR